MPRIRGRDKMSSISIIYAWQAAAIARAAQRYTPAEQNNGCLLILRREISTWPECWDDTLGQFLRDLPIVAVLPTFCHVLLHRSAPPPLREKNEKSRILMRYGDDITTPSFFLGGARPLQIYGALFHFPRPSSLNAHQPTYIAMLSHAHIIYCCGLSL